MNKINKYKEYFSGLILSAYLFFFILNIFHYHHVSLYSDFQIRNEKDATANNTDIYFLNLNVICQFQSTFSSIQTTDDFNNYIFSSDKNTQRLNSDSKFDISFLKNFPGNNPLRAPPSR
ncbi:MAG: hypothetical protein A2W11_02405 [Ignavibacteria bacterium RBG_16_35_7]|nr:MAG: hypothetical protein A2W11_02405 [Ignavibacteria bacterium RBG_16_35_7]